ncbi:MAG: site-2 protease family protein [Planctomycetota bacterium]
MTALPGLLGTLFDLLLVVFGFGAIIFVHELGHFITARWAGIRVLAFAVGFGPAAVSFRKGFGLQRGSSDERYRQLLADAQSEASETQEHARAQLAGPVSPTEYRLNWLPLGGYVKMLGQEDGNPAATSDAADSYQNCPVPKRLVVISGGVIMNVILAFVLFIGVFMAGLRVEPAIVGSVDPTGPAAKATPIDNDTNPAGLNAGLLPGDVIVGFNNDTPRRMLDVVTGTLLAKKGQPVTLVVERDGFDEPLTFEAMPEDDTFTNMPSLGIAAPLSNVIEPRLARTPGTADGLARVGLDGIQPGAVLVEAAGQAITRATELPAIINSRAGAPIELKFEQPDGSTAVRTITPEPDYQTADTDPAPDVVVPMQHLLGLVPVMAVSPPTDPANPTRGYTLGLRAGDVFQRLGSVEYPSIEAGIAEVKRNRGSDISAVVVRTTEAGTEHVELELSVLSNGTIGFAVTDSAATSTLLAEPPEMLLTMKNEPYDSPARDVLQRPGARIVTVNDAPVASYADIRRELRAATADAFTAGEGASVELLMSLPYDDDATEVRTWNIDADAVQQLHTLGWNWRGVALFAPEQMLEKASNPLDAIVLGVEETHLMMTQVYLTLRRLIEGSVRVESLSGPVGIAHIGTSIADRGPAWLVFFMAMLSVNLAVINFLPLPIVDGGQFLMLLYEWAAGKPLPIRVQEVLTMIGLIGIVSIFLLVTFNDISRLLG